MERSIVFDNPVGTEGYTHPYRRESIQKNLFLSEQPEDAELTSAVEELFNAPPKERGEALKAVLASQFMAAIPENQNVDNLEELFARSSFMAHRVGSDEQIRGVLTEIRASLLDETKGALARAASPLHLTDFGIEANKTGFSPESCRHIVEILRQERQETLLTLLHEFQYRVSSIGAELLRSLGTLPEQTHGNLRKAISTQGKGLCVKSSDFESVLSLWLSGESPEYIFTTLPYAQRSKKTPRIQEWRAGLIDLSNWDADFDKFVEFISAVFENFLPWLMRGCSYLSTFAPGWSETIDWQLWAEMVEKGVDSKWAVEALNQDAPASRKTVVIMGRKLPSAYLTVVDPLGITSLKNDLGVRQYIERVFQDTIREVGGSESLEASEIAGLRNWLWRQADLPIKEIADL